MQLNLERLDFLIAHYVSGSLPEPARVLVGSHLEMRNSSAVFARSLENLAGGALESSETSEISNRSRRLSSIFSSDAPPLAPSMSAEESALPIALRSYAGADLPEIPWKSKLPGFRRHVIDSSETAEASLLWVRPGRALPAHTHHGLELTLVLDGEFHDHRGNFAEGDVSVADEELDHRPVAGNDKPCICFSVLFAPIALSGSSLRLMGDIIGI